jgi:outer membrane protein assembly factor BamB
MVSMKRRYLVLVLAAWVCCGVWGCGGRATTAIPGPLAETVAGDADEDLPADLGTRKGGSDWPGFLGPTGDGKSSEKGIVAPWPAEGLRLVWQRRLGEGYAMPSVSRGRLFLFDRQGDLARLTCLHSETGEFLWEYTYATDYEDHYGYSNGPRCCPVVDGGRVYIFGPEGQLHCVRVRDGRLVWKADTAARFGVVQNFFGVGSTPVVEGNLLLVQVGGSPPGSGSYPSLDQQGNGSGIVAFDKRTGQVRYQLSDELASYTSPVLATLGGRRWCFVFARGGLIGFEPRSGKLDFHFPWRARILESVNAANPVVFGEHVLISECYGPGAALLKVRPGGYEVVWSDAERGRDKALQAHWATPIYHEGFIYGDSGRHSASAELRCIEAMTGKVRWRHRGLGHVSLLWVDGYFVCLSEFGELLLVRANPDRYDEVSRMEVRDAEGRSLLDYPAWAAPIVAHGLLYVRGKDRLVCLELIPQGKR